MSFVLYKAIFPWCIWRSNFPAQYTINKQLQHFLNQYIVRHCQWPAGKFHWLPVFLLNFFVSSLSYSLYKNPAVKLKKVFIQPLSLNFISELYQKNFTELYISVVSLKSSSGSYVPAQSYRTTRWNYQINTEVNHTGQGGKSQTGQQRKTRGEKQTHTHYTPNQTKPYTPQNQNQLFSRRLSALDAHYLKSICWEKDRSSGGQVITSPVSQETFSRLLAWHPT